MLEIIDEYKKVRELYPKIKDTDGALAYKLMQKSNVLRSYFDEKFVESEKILLIYKNEIDIVKSRLSISYDPKNSTNGNRKATADEEYKEAIENYAKQKEVSEMLERQIEFLKNISFQMFSVWDNCKKNGERY